MCRHVQVQVDDLQQRASEATRQATTWQQKLTAAEEAHSNAAKVTCNFTFTPVFVTTVLACAMEYVALSG